MPRIILPGNPLYTPPPPGTPLNLTSPLTSGLIAPAFLTLESGGGTLYDSLTGKGATFSNPAWAPGPMGLGLAPSFNGTNGSVTATGPAFGTSGTVAFWMCPTFTMAATSHYLFDTTSTQRYLFYKNANSTTAWAWYVNGVAVGGDTSTSLQNIGATGVWAHIALVWTASAQTVYKNGVKFAAFTTALTAATPANLYLGQRNSAIAFWQGGLDQFLAWNRALSAAEIQQLYVQPTGILLPQRRIWVVNTPTGAGFVSGSGSINNTDTLAGAGVILNPAPVSGVTNINTVTGTAAVLVPAPNSTLANLGTLGGVGTVLVPAPTATVADINTLAGAGSVLVPSSVQTLSNVNTLAGTSVVLVRPAAASITNSNTLSGAGVVLVPSIVQTLANVNTLAGTGVVLVPSSVQTLSNINTLAGGAVVLSPAPAGVLANANTVAGSGVVSVPSGNATFANTNSLSNSSAAFVAAPPGIVGNSNALTGTATVLVPSTSATLSGVGTLSGAGVVLVPSGIQTLAGVGALSGSGSAVVLAAGTVAAIGGVSGSGVVMVPAAPETVAGVGALSGHVGPVILSFYALYRAAPRPSIYRAGSRVSRYTAAPRPNLYRASSRISLYMATPRRNLYRAKGAVGMSALQDSGQQNCVLRVGEQNQPYFIDFKTVPLGTGEHVTACSIVVKQVTDMTSTDVTATLCPVQPTSGDIVNDVVAAYLNGVAAIVGAKYKVIYYATTNATKQPTVRVEDISFVQCDE